MSTENIENAAEEQQGIALSDEQLDAEFLRILNLKTEDDKKTALAKPKQVKMQVCQNFVKLEGKQSKENSAKSLVDSVAQTGHVELVRKIKVLLRTAPVSWFEEFIAAQGLPTLSKALAKANSDKNHGLQGELVQSFKIMCVGKTQQLDTVIKTEGVVLNLVGVILATEDVELKTDLFAILAAIAGCSATSAAQVEEAMVKVFANDFSPIAQSVTAVKDQEYRINALLWLNRVANNLSDKANFVQLVKSAVSAQIAQWSSDASLDLSKEIATLNSLIA